MLSLRRNSVWALMLLLACCQKVELTPEPGQDTEEGKPASTADIRGTGLGTQAYPFTPTDIRNGAKGGEVWVIGYVVGTAPRAMTAATFDASSTNQSNILLSEDSLCTDTARCIPVELSSSKIRQQFALPGNAGHFRHTVMLCGTPSVYLYRRGLRNVSTGLWLDGFDLSSIAPEQWETIILP